MINQLRTYRGVRIDNGEWAYGAYFCLHHNDERTHIHHFIIPDNTPIPKDKPIGEIQVEVILATVGQFTGLVDRKGTKIYENDIVAIRNAKRFTTGFVGFPHGYTGVTYSKVGTIEGHTYVWINPIIKGKIHRFGAQLLFEGQSNYIDMRGVATSDVLVIGTDCDLPKLYQ